MSSQWQYCSMKYFLGCSSLCDTWSCDCHVFSSIYVSNLLIIYLILISILPTSFNSHRLYFKQTTGYCVTWQYDSVCPHCIWDSWLTESSLHSLWLYLIKVHFLMNKTHADLQGVDLIYLLLIADILCRLPKFKKNKNPVHTKSFSMFLLSEMI